MWTKMIYLIAFWTAKGFQSLLRELSRQLERLHDLVIVWLTVIIIIVRLIRLQTLIGPFGILRPDSEALEQGWTILPILILIRIAYPRIHLLCLQDFFLSNPQNTIKVISNQWNWQREFEDRNDHLLDVDQVENIASYENPIVIQQKTPTRFIINRTDVLHSLGLPALGIKLDAIPGRLNATILEARLIGIIPGSCFELCGRGHRVIPIQLLVY